MVNNVPQFFVWCLLMLSLVLTPEAWATHKKHAQVIQEVISNPEVYLASPPQFLRPDGECYFVAIDIPYDLFYLDNGFYLLYRGAWFVSDFFEGPWEKLRKEKTPVLLRSFTTHKIDEIRKQIVHKFEQNKHIWPTEARFIPETIDSESLGNDELIDAEMVPSGSELQQETE